MALAPSEVQFSVLILTIPSRVEKYWTPLCQHLDKQIADTGAKVEVLTLADNKAMTIGEKRQALLDISRGKWVGFLDDDDWVSDDYIASLSQAMNDKPADVITFEQDCTVNSDKFKVDFRVGNPHEPYVPNSGVSLIRRPPYHMCLWRSEIAKSEAFNPVYGANGQSSEDNDWLMRLYPKIQTEHHIDDSLHGYIYSSETTTSLVPQDEQ